MTVKELIERLKQFPEDSEIAIELLGGHGEYVAATSSQFTEYDVFESADDSIVIQGIG